MSEEVEVDAEPSKWAKAKETWFGPITSDNAETVVRQSSKAWIGLGFLNVAVFSFISLANGAYSANLVDGILCIVCGYFLRRRKSRALATGLLVYAIYVAGITALGRFKIIEPQGGNNIILAAMVIVVGWRGWRAVYIYHNDIGDKISWWPVCWISTSILVVGGSVLIVSWIVAATLIPGSDEYLAGQIAVSTVSVVAAMQLALLTRWFPFHKQ